MTKSTRQAIDGVLLLDKHAGLTSNAALQWAKRLFNAKKAGHTGTLDPFANGLLPLCFGEATKFSQYLLEADKTYRAVLQLGVTTTTGDPEGEVMATHPVAATCEDIGAILPRFMGGIEQVPPMHSALKHQGRPLYEYARAGIEIDRAPRRVQIRSLELIECAPPRAVLDIQCSAGTYIRTLAQEIGAALGCGAHLSALTRIASGGFSLADAHSLTRLEALDLRQRHALLLPVECLLAHLPAIQLDETSALALRQGRSITHRPLESGLVRAYGPDLKFLGVAQAGADSFLRPQRLVATNLPA